MLQKQNIEKGATLLELLVVIGIIGILTTVGLVRFNNNKDQKAVDAAAREVIGAVRQAQENALNGKQETSTNAIECGYGIYIPNSGAPNYQIYYNSAADCSTDSGAYGGSSSVINLSLKNGANFSTVIEGDNVPGVSKNYPINTYFKIPYGKSYSYSQGLSTNYLAIAIKIVKNSAVKYVCICRSGRMNDMTETQYADGKCISGHCGVI